MQGVAMNYVKKMCILRQLKQGFSGDGKALSGLVKIEQYGKNLSVEVSIINFAPLALGEYYCLLSDGKGKTEMLSLRGKSIFNILSDLQIAHGFCAVICYVKSDVVPIAYGINGNGSYDWKTILNATLPPVFPQKQPPKKTQEPALEEAVSQTFASTLTSPINDAFMQAPTTPSEEEPPKEVPQNTTATIAQTTAYDDEEVANENYYEENEHGQELLEKTSGDAYAQSTTQSTAAQKGVDTAQNVDADNVRHSFKTDGDGYYHAVKAEIDELFAAHPRDDTLKNAFSCSEWVRIKSENSKNDYLVGVVYDDGKAKYICYALAAEDPSSPPEEIRSVCTFVPVSCLQGADGYFVIFQSAATGECIPPQKA